MNNHNSRVKKSRSLLMMGGIASLASLIFSSAHAQEMTFPVGGETAISVQWKGDEQARAGQEFRYRLQIENVTDVPVQEVIVHQTVPSSFQVKSSQPEAQSGSQTGARALSSDAREMMKEAEKERRLMAADSAEMTQKKQKGQNGQKDQQQANNQNGQNNQQQANNQNGKNNQQQANNQDRQNNQQQANNQDRQNNQQQANNQDRQNNQQQANQQQNQKRQLSWQVGSLDAGETKTIQVTGLPREEGNMEACLWVTFQPTYCKQIEVVKPDLELVQTIVDQEGKERTTFYECEPILAKYVLTNTGSGETKNVKIQTQLPDGLKVEDQSQLEVDALGQGESVERTVRLATNKTGNYDVSAKATTGQLQASTQSTQIEVLKPELQLDVQAPKKAYLGRSVTYDVKVTNNGDIASLNTKVSVPISASGLRFSSTGEQVGSDVNEFTMDRIEPGESKSFGLTFDPSEKGPINVDVTATAYCAADAKQQVKTMVEGVAALQLVVVDRQDPVKVGNETVYEVQVRNEGSAEGLNINLTGQMPQMMKMVEASGDSNVEAQGGTLTFGKVGKLAPGEVVSWLVTAQGESKGKGALVLDLKSDGVENVKSSEPTTVY